MTGLPSEEGTAPEEDATLVCIWRFKHNFHLIILRGSYCVS
jgi:hypothetical protein